MNRELLCQIEVADALTMMRSLPDRSIDCIITDPPDSETDLAWNHALDWAEFWREAQRISKTSTIHALFTHQPFEFDRTCPDCKALRYGVVWKKTRAQGFWQKSVYAPYAPLGDPNPIQKPLDPLKWIVATYSHPEDLILDPFLGSGTTAIVCQELGRHFIGCDSNPDYVAIARDRVAQTAPSLTYAA